ncbi:MAG: CPBP family intramembrane metalloprotease [Paludibacteraceae bacterium]|nr:CPBP family intramembrane metalloprotease [Paludibacteraceae bacterium]
MALQGKYEQSHVALKVIQWLGCILFLNILAAGSIFFFEQPLSINALKWVQFFQSSAMFLLPPLCMAYLWAQEPLKWLKVSKFQSFKVYGAAILLMLVALPAINLLGYLNQQMTLPAFLKTLEQWMKTSEESAKLLTEQFLGVTTIGGLIINILLMALLPAVAEELTFRGVLIKLFQAKGERIKTKSESIPHMAIWCSAILFSAIHMQFYGFLPRMLMGALFGYMLVWTGSLWTPILMHFTNNATAVILYFVALRKGWNIEEIDAIGTNDTLWLGVVSMVITIVGIYAFRRSTTMSNASSRMSSGN